LVDAEKPRKSSCYPSSQAYESRAQMPVTHYPVITMPRISKHDKQLKPGEIEGCEEKEPLKYENIIMM